MMQEFPMLDKLTKNTDKTHQKRHGEHRDSNDSHEGDPDEEAEGPYDTEPFRQGLGAGHEHPAVSFPYDFRQIKGI